jgi:hypothetical protein
MRRALASSIVLSTFLVVVSAGVAHPVVPIEPVITGKGEQYRAFVNDTYITYTDWVRRTQTSRAFAQTLAGGVRERLNATGTGGEVGGFDPGTNTVILQQWTNRRSGLYFYDLDTDLRTKAAGVNSERWEWNPLISASFIVYNQDFRRGGDWYTSLKVFRRDTQVTRTLGTWRSNVSFPGSAGDQYIAYTLCTKTTCHAHLYEWATKTDQRIPTRNGRSQYAPVVDEANSTVYFSRSGNQRCGQEVNIWRRPIPLVDGDPLEKIVELPDGIDTGWESSLAANAASGEMDLYIERYACERRTGDVYVARGVDLIPA